ncbi:hypothetical protein [Kribbella sp. NPDC051770]|uniref:hypothetical protein n=1 Tax=Kribbella sp. NPDC051770 TaxID=3155413 RepID=UPI00342FA9A3
MSQPHSGMPGQPPPIPLQPIVEQPHEKPRRSIRRIVGLGVAGAALFVAGGLTVALTGIGDTTDRATTSDSRPAAAASTAPTIAETSETTPEPAYAVPTKADFKLTAKILGKQCFGSAGCNLTYRIMVAYSGEAPDPAVTYEVVYVVQGGDDGPVTNTLKVTGDQSSVDEEESISTANKAKKLTVVVSEVLAS